MKFTSPLSLRGARRTWVAAGTALVVTAGLTGFALQGASASGTTYQPYDETDSPNPYNLTEALAFYKAADMGWIVNAPIADVHSLAYTVADGTSYAPSFQLVTTSTAKPYARLVWEPYQQAGNLNPNKGAYTDLQDGVWWTNKIASGKGSQSDPQPLSFFSTPVADGGAGWTDLTVYAVDVHQGTTTDATSIVTKVNYNGTDIPLGNADATPYDAADIAAATAPLAAQITDLQADKTALQSQVDALTSQKAALQSQVDALNAYKNTHHVADGYNLGLSRALLSATPVHGKTVGIALSGTITKATSVKYQWYLSGKAVPGATKSTYKVPSNAKGRAVSVRVTGTYNYIVFSIHSNTVTTK